jgi:diaminopimelate epimerase
MIIDFTKMHGLGNDFVVIDAVRQAVALDAGRVRAIADRRFGVGCDQVLLVEPPRSPTTEFHYRIFNADGGEVEQCGNGARCFARFVRDKGLTTHDEIPVGTAAGEIRLFVEDDDQVRVDMGVPRLEPAAIPFTADAPATQYELDTDDRTWTLGAVSMGNPHAVLRVDDVAEAPVARLGPIIEHHPRFPQRANVGFMTVCARDHIHLRVFERGSGETLACGTGACAAVVYGRLNGWLDERVGVDLPGGRLVVSWRDRGEPVWMTGPAVAVFEGRLDIDRLPRDGSDSARSAWG